MQNYFVSVTSQGQITIPVKIRRALKLDKNRRAQVRLEGNTMLVEPVLDFMELEGIFHDRAIKGKTIQEIIKLEEEAVAEQAAEDYKRSLKRMTNEPRVY